MEEYLPWYLTRPESNKQSSLPASAGVILTEYPTRSMFTVAIVPGCSPGSVDILAPAGKTSPEKSASENTWGLLDSVTVAAYCGHLCLARPKAEGALLDPVTRPPLERNFAHLGANFYLNATARTAMKNAPAPKLYATTFWFGAGFSPMGTEGFGSRS